MLCACSVEGSFRHNAFSAVFLCMQLPCSSNAHGISRRSLFCLVFSDESAFSSYSCKFNVYVRRVYAVNEFD